jgi:GTPase SAR1 family protein
MLQVSHYNYGMSQVTVRFSSTSLNFFPPAHATFGYTFIERFGGMTRVYYKYAIAGLVVFDLSRPATFDAVLKWRDDVNSKVQLADERPIPLLLLANKCDLPGVELDSEMLSKFAQDNGFVGWYAVSAQDNIGINDAMQFLVKSTPTSVSLAVRSNAIEILTPWIFLDILEVSKTAMPKSSDPDAITVTHVNTPQETTKKEDGVFDNCCK